MLLLVFGGIIGMFKFILCIYDDYVFNVMVSVVFCWFSVDDVYLVVLVVGYNFLLVCLGLFGVMIVGVIVVFVFDFSLEVVFVVIECYGVIVIVLVLVLVKLWV